MPLQEVAGAIIGIHHPAITMVRQQHPGLLADKVAGQQLGQALAQHDLNLDIDLGLVSCPSGPFRPQQLRDDQLSRLQHQGDHRFEQGAINTGGRD
ncbi:hypothetical protein FQZ97_917430 [compost metagenome]